MKGFGLAAPALILLLGVLVLPVLSVLAASFTAPDAQDGAWSMAQYADIVSRPYAHAAFLRTVLLGAGIAGACLLLSLPLCDWMVRYPRWRTTLLIALTAPMMVNVVARLYGWQLLLSDSGPVNRLLGGAPTLFVGSMTGVAIVMVHVMLPYAAIPLFNSMRAIDPAARDAARTLGANPWRVFWAVVLPQSLPGLVTGFTLVFTLSAASFIVPAVMGGGRINTVPTLVYQEMMALNFSRAAALAALLLVVLLPLAWLSRLLSQPAS